jgi:hypothetical protein
MKKEFRRNNKTDDLDWLENKLVSLSDAAKKLGYTPEYLNKLCRKKLMKGKKLGRNWFTTKEWAQDYLDKEGRDSRKERGLWISIEKEIPIDEEKEAPIPLMESLRIEDTKLLKNDQFDSKVTEITDESIKIFTDEKKEKRGGKLNYIRMMYAFSIFIIAVFAGNYYLDFISQSSEIEKIYGNNIKEKEGFVKGEEVENAPGTNVAFASENFQLSEINVGGDVDIMDNDENTPLKMFELDSEGFTTKDKKEYRMLVKWKTNKMSRSEIEIAKQNSQDTKTLVEDDYGFDHVAVISKLDFSNAYIYTIRSRDKWGNEIESDAFGFYTGSRDVSVFEMIIEALTETFGWAMKK